MTVGDRVVEVDVRRVYQPANPQDGYRVLVDRIWPRGLTKADAAVDEWCRDIAPSTELRRWYGHDPELFPVFRLRYLTELEDAAHRAALEHLFDLGEPRLTLVTSTRQVGISNASVLAERLRSTPSA